MVRTNHHWRPLLPREDVPAKVLASDFGYQNPEEGDGLDGFFRYKGQWYHLDQFMRFGYPGRHTVDERGEEWEAGMHFHAWAGLMIRVRDENDGEVMVGYYTVE